MRPNESHMRPNESHMRPSVSQMRPISFLINEESPNQIAIAVATQSRLLKFFQTSAATPLSIIEYREISEYLFVCIKKG